MSTNKSHLSSVSSRSDDSAADAQSTLRRDIALAVIVGALLLAGLGVGGSNANHQEPLLAKTDTAAVQPVEETVYFPSQYVNQGMDDGDNISTF